MKSERTDEAVSEIVGTVLLLGITVIFFFLLCVVMPLYPSSSPPSTNLVGMIEGEYLLLEHRGGEALNLETKVILTTSEGTSKSITIGDKNYLNNEARQDNLWGIGEWLIYQDKDIVGKQVGVTVIDIESNSVIMTGSLKGT